MAHSAGGRAVWPFQPVCTSLCWVDRMMNYRQFTPGKSKLCHAAGPDLSKQSRPGNICADMICMHAYAQGSTLPHMSTCTSRLQTTPGVGVCSYVPILWRTQGSLVNWIWYPPWRRRWAGYATVASCHRITSSYSMSARRMEVHWGAHWFGFVPCSGTGT